MDEDFLNRFLGSGGPAPDPVEAVRRSTKRVLPRRFWRKVAVVEREGGFAVALDGKAIKTPGRHELVVPSRPLAEALADEWRALGDEIDPANMPLTRLLYAAIDAVAPNPAPVAAAIVGYARSDLLCYREAKNERLAARQTAHWDAPLAFAREALGARLVLAAGVIFVEQPPEALEAIGRAVARAPVPFGLAALHSSTTLTGSAILALALAAGELSADGAWTAAHVDEDLQIEAWGVDAEATARRAARRAEFDAAALVLSALPWSGAWGK